MLHPHVKGAASIAVAHVRVSLILPPPPPPRTLTLFGFYNLSLRPGRNLWCHRPPPSDQHAQIQTSCLTPPFQWFYFVYILTLHSCYLSNPFVIQLSISLSTTGCVSVKPWFYYFDTVSVLTSRKCLFCTTKGEKHMLDQWQTTSYLTNNVAILPSRVYIQQQLDGLKADRRG